MRITDEKPAAKGPHNVILEDRKRISVTGVKDVDSFDEETMVVYTDMGELTLRGQGLRIDRLNTETGELSVNGSVFALVYTDDRPKSGWRRLFR